MNNKTKQTSKHGESGHHEEDNCEGCQQQRRENGMLVDFYDRLGRIEAKVEKIRESVGPLQQREAGCRKRMESMGQIMMSKPEQSLRIIREHDSKEMGYQLASALIQREIKTKMENQRLQQIIEQLQRDKLRLQQQKHNFSGITSKLDSKSSPVSPFSDVLDIVSQTNDSSDFIDKRRKKDKGLSSSYFTDEGSRKYWEDGSTGQEETSFSSFPTNKEGDHRKYDGLNLWLYQFKPEELQESPLKSLRKPAGQKKQQKGDRYKSKF